MTNVSLKRGAKSYDVEFASASGVENVDDERWCFEVFDEHGPVSENAGKGLVSQSVYSFVQVKRNETNEFYNCQRA